MRYALITAARNESRFIGETIRAVCAQTVLPGLWVIVSDGSTDGTDEIVKRRAREAGFIRLIRMEDGAARNFASQAYGLNRAAAALPRDGFDFIGCLDADITLDPDYYQKVLAEFARDTSLGVAGGFIHERASGAFAPRPLDSPQHVAGAIQMFRRECFKLIGPFTPLPNGGLDTVAELRAEREGFTVRSFPDLHVYHHRPTGGSDAAVPAAFKAGLMDYQLGYLPLYELAVCARRAGLGIPIVGSLVRLIGFCGCYLSRRARLVPGELIGFLREKQRSRLTLFLSRLLRGRRVGFEL